jgi:phage-related holin
MQDVLLWLYFCFHTKNEKIDMRESLEQWLAKYSFLALAALCTFLNPIVPTLCFVGMISVIDFVTGIIGAKSKGEEIKSSKMIRKFYAVMAYFLGILIAHVLEGYFGDVVPMTKAVVAIIAVTEIQSVRENITAITGVDILKPLERILIKKSEQE